MIDALIQADEIWPFTCATATNVPIAKAEPDGAGEFPRKALGCALMAAVRLAAPLTALSLLLLLQIAAAASAAELRGQVVGVHDGDTLTLLTPGQEQVRIRLAEIDAPEARQPWGTRARQALAAMAFQKPATVAVVDTDRYGRTVGTVWVEGRNVNAEMVRSGHAWVYRQYLRDRSLLAVEDEARRARRGLWRLPEAERVPPWMWRRERRHP